MIQQIENLKQRVTLLRSTGDISLQKIKQLETYLNKRKQQNQYPLQEDINTLNQLVKSQLKMLAEIKTCEYFIACYEAISIFSQRYIEMTNTLFKGLMQQFLFDLQMKRKKRFKQIQRRQRQQRQQQKQQLNLQIYPVDFTI